MVSLMCNPKCSEDGRAENPDFSILVAEDKPAEPFAGLFGAALPVENRHMLTSANDAEIFEFFGQIFGKLAVGELVADRNLIHGKRHGTGEILDELSVLAFARMLDEVAPKGLGDGPYLLVGFFNDVNVRFPAARRDRRCRVHLSKINERHAGSFTPRQRSMRTS